MKDYDTRLEAAMINIFNTVELVIFDLDGTLYEDTDHFKYYAQLLKEELPEEVHNDYLREYGKMEAGQHIVTIGKVYDVVRDYVLKLDAISSTILQAWNWDGEELDREDVQRLYPNPITLDFDSMIAIGDGWWLPNVCARHYGAQNTQDAYVKTKEYMNTDQFHLTKIPGLREGLLHLKEKKKIVLLTNSEKDDVERLLTNLNLNGIFDDIVTEARKPQYTNRHFTNLLEKYNMPAHSGLSIGDNYLNEIAPALNLNMQTVFIDFYGLDYPEYQGVKVKSISDLINSMNEL